MTRQTISAVLLALPAAVLAAAPGRAAEPIAAEVYRLTGPLRDRTASIEKQLRAVRELAAAGEPGVKAWRDHLARELDRLGRLAATRPTTQVVDREIAGLRESLARLRADPDLTKEKLEASGLPALDALEKAAARRAAVLQGWRTKQVAAHAQAERLATLVEACRDAAADGGPLAAAGPFDPAPVRELAARLGPEDAEAARVLAANAKICATLAPEVAAGTQAVDAVRMLCGLAPLPIDTKLCAACTDHSADMEQHGFFAHRSPLPGKTDPADRARLAGTTASAENIYAGSTSGPDAVKAWFLSPGHHKNLLADGHRRQGLGRAGKHWTQLFGN